MGGEVRQTLSSSMDDFITMFPLVSLIESNCVSTALVFSVMSLILLYIKQQKDKSLAQLERAKKSNLKLLPTPPKLPMISQIVGHMYLMRDYQDNPWDGLNAIRVQYGDVVALQMGVHPMVLVSSYKIMKEILLDKGEVFANRPNFPRYHIIFGGDRENSLALCSWSGTHKDRRKFCKRGIAPSKFSFRNILLESIVSKHVSEFCSKFDLQTGNVQTTANSRQSSHIDRTYSVATKEDILFLTSDIFMEYLCSENHSHSDPDYKKFVNGCDFVFWDINQSYLIDFLPYLSSTVGYFYLKQLRQVTDFLRLYIDDKIFNPRLKFLTEQESLDETDTDYLNSIINEYLSKVSTMSLADYRVGFEDLLAGHAAVANILMRLLGHLSVNLAFQDMIYEEAKEAEIERSDRRPSLPITEAVVQEALRLASSPIVPHVAREDTSMGDYFVPEGTMVLFNLYYLNLSPQFWTSPLEFDPMRLIETSKDSDGILRHKLRPPKHFMPFSQGPRQCLGFKMVETISILAVANLCKKYIIKPDDEDLVKRLLVPKGMLALNPEADCYNLRLYPR